LLPSDGLTLQDFVAGAPRNALPTTTENSTTNATSGLKTFSIRTYGCQMNVNDTDIVRSLLYQDGWTESTVDPTAKHNDDSSAPPTVVLTNTCAIREGAERKVWQRLQNLRAQKTKTRNLNKKHKLKSNHYHQQQRTHQIVGVLGCMAERLQADLLQEGLADVVVGPDAYRDLPRLLNQQLEMLQESTANRTAFSDSSSDPYAAAMNVELSLDETYADITPIRSPSTISNLPDVSAFVSIQRGCSNRCSFCIVPFTRGQERSRPLQSILDEVRQLHFEQGVKEVTLLGQNVNSYHDTSDDARAAQPESPYRMSNTGFRSRIRRQDAGYFFADLLEQVSDLSSELRVRFTSPHPKDYPPELLHLMAERPNICNHLHMPAQSGSTSVLKRMKRGYSRDAYLELMNTVRDILPDVALSSDFIAGFCDETEEEHKDTLSLLEQVRYDQAFLFAYSMRGKTHAHRTMQDNVPEDVKQRRLRELIDTFQHHVHQKNVDQEIGRLRLVLVEGQSKRSQDMWSGRTDQNKRILFPVDGVDDNILCRSDECFQLYQQDDVPLRSEAWRQQVLQAGDYAVVQVTEAKGHTLRGKLLCRTTLTNFGRSGLSGVDGASLERADRFKKWFHEVEGTVLPLSDNSPAKVLKRQML